MQCACTLLYCHLWPVRIYNIFQYYLIKVTILEKQLLSVKCVFLYSLQLLFVTIFILRRIQRDVIEDVREYYCTLFRYSWQNLVTLSFLDKFLKNTKISNFIKTSPVGAGLFHADGQAGITRLVFTFRNFLKEPKHRMPSVPTSRRKFSFSRCL
jgi:hypothetical protein